MSARRFSCLVPAYNEGPRISAVLEALVGHPDLDRVLVVDDGSADATAEIARATGAEVLTLARNGGKTAALAAGIAALETEFIVLIDADLEGLTADAISRLVAPVRAGECAVTLSLRGNAPGLWRWIGIDYISGERVIPRRLIAPHLERLGGLPGFGFEVFLNRLIVAEKLAVRVVNWPEVASPAKSRKRGFWPGMRADAAMLRDMFGTISPIEAAAQILRLRRR